MDENVLQEYYSIIKDKILHVNFESAIRSADKLLRYYQDSLALYYKGVCSFALEKYNNAIKFNIEALQLKPDFAKAYFNLGASYYISNKYDDALINIGKALILFTREKELDAKQRCINALTYIQDERRA